MQTNEGARRLQMCIDLEKSDPPVVHFVSENKWPIMCRAGRKTLLTHSRITLLSSGIMFLRVISVRQLYYSFFHYYTLFSRIYYASVRPKSGMHHVDQAFIQTPQVWGDNRHWGMRWDPQRGPGAEPLVRRSGRVATQKLKAFRCISSFCVFLQRYWYGNRASRSYIHSYS